MPSLVKLLLISAALAVVSKADPAETQSRDPCAVLAKTTQDKLTYKTVADCYHAIDFNPKEAKETIDTLTTFYNDVFVFRDIAMTPKLKEPLSSPPVDAQAVLKKIGRKRYRRDFDFHNDLTMFANSYNDAHTSYKPECYISHIFLQPLSLYAPVIDGRQSIRVHTDSTKSKLEDCEVTRINGRDARATIQDWANKNTGFSKDAGVRFNHALSSHVYWPESKLWLSAPGMFSIRYRLPETPFLDYELKCGKKGATRRFRGEWQTMRLVDEEAFTDKASFVSNVCAHESRKPRASGKKKNARAMDPELFTQILGMLYEREHGHKPDTSLKDMPDAKLWASNNTAAYQLKSMPHVGVIVIPSMEMQAKTEIPAIQGYLTQLAKNGVTNIIIDMSGNFGGEEDFASLLPSIFFKTDNKITHNQPSRFRVTPSAQAIAEANLKNQKVDSYWNPSSLTDIETGTPFKTNPFTSNVVNLTYQGRSAAFSQKVFFDYDLGFTDPSIRYPWSDDPSKITILTDGQCGSACGMTSDFFVRVHGVKTVAVGGHKGKALSMYSFPGASVIDTDEYVQTFEDLGLKSTIRRLPYANSVSVGVTMVFLANDTVPFEFNSDRFPSAFRLDYGPQTARNHDQLWAAVAKTVWK